MFRKPFKVKSNTQLKSSERKKLLKKIEESFSSYAHSSFNVEDLPSIFPSKEAVTTVKIITSAQEICSVYVCQNMPLFYEYENVLYPTIFVLWKLPFLLPSIIVYSGVFDHLLKGADLMIPGIKPSQQMTPFSPGTFVYIRNENNLAAVAVGISQVSSQDMMSPGSKGKGVIICHTLNDELSKMCEDVQELPLIEESAVSPEKSVESIVDPFQDVHVAEVPTPQDNLAEDTKVLETEGKMTMDQLLTYCFIKGIKKHYSKISLPILTNLFYKNCMLGVVPESYNLDIKKTKFKKLSTFLNEMKKNDVLAIEDVKGVQSILSINIGHEIFKNFVDDYPETRVEAKETRPAMEIIEKNVVTPRMENIFGKYNYRKGASLSDQEVRRVLTDYVKSENLLSAGSKEVINLNGPLCDLIQTKELNITWKDLFARVLSKMSKCYEIHTPSNKILSGKGALPIIELTVTIKTSNKKVTMVKNLELYGINLEEFSKECEHGVAASSTITAVPNSKSALFQIQGNQKRFIGDLLQEKYCIPKKCISGLEEAKGKKK